jgi:hypothetical protein
MGRQSSTLGQVPHRTRALLGFAGLAALLAAAARFAPVASVVR